MLPARIGAAPWPAAAAAITAAAAAAAAKTTAAAWPRRLRPRFVHRQGASTELMAVELRNRLLRIIVAGHLDERESAGAAGDAVAHHGDRFHLARLAEQRLEILLHSFVRQIAHEEFAAHMRLLRMPWHWLVSAGDASRTGSNPYAQ